MNRADILNKVASIINERRNKAFATASANHEAARKDKTFCQLDDQARALTVAVAYDKACGKDVSEREKQLKQCESERQKRLKTLHLDLSPQFFCPLCQDTGKTQNGDACECVKQLYRELLHGSVTLGRLPSFTFADDRSATFAGNVNLKNAYAAMKRFAENFPNSDKSVLIFSGSVGTGKSCLMAATAHALIERGFTVAYCTAFDWNNMLIKYHTAPIEEKADIIDPLLSSDMLMIDDLGTEPVFNKVTLEYLYDIASSRVSAGKAMMITTNLNSEELMHRYGERTYSRLTNKQYSAFKSIDGEDLRHM